ncbi:hypothetical protein BDV96DRAFT_198906 [Lophiotrema nucula]|uniref:Uncharacterized protein n=1 Tax=Lophiotrema nucula TaxID=690887 RepID=A0A6A5YUP3_9PLEO|nr:hypothetical protein BDV96DRAFT_198906 [Lophiotrema nucula]
MFFDVALALVGHRTELVPVPRTYEWNAIPGSSPFALCSPRGFTGLETVHLKLTAEEYFHLFNVRVPPFSLPEYLLDSRYRAIPMGAAQLLSVATQSLVLEFDTSDSAWYGIDRFVDRWDKESWDEARLRPNTCDRGLAIDWILTFAWAQGHIKTLQHLELRGDVQEWVKQKWIGPNGVLKGWKRRDCEYPSFEYTPDLTAIAEIGRKEAMENDNGNDEYWEPWMFYPPKCMCQIPCNKFGIHKPSTSSVAEVGPTAFDTNLFPSIEMSRPEGGWYDSDEDPVVENHDWRFGSPWDFKAEWEDCWWVEPMCDWDWVPCEPDVYANLHVGVEEERGI